MSGWDHLPDWEQLVGGMLSFGNNFSAGGDFDFERVGRSLWDLPDHLSACTVSAALPNPGSGLVVSGPPFYYYYGSAGSNNPNSCAGDYVTRALQCLITGHYRLFLILLFLAGCITVIYIISIYAAAALAYDCASSHPYHALALAVSLFAIRRGWRELYGGGRGQQREREQPDREHDQPECALGERQPQHGQRKQRQPRRKQRQ